ncbi:uncharacterized protein LOC122505560 [Leptopilina heterotoma]|uniref:uncharacterized protein LOC122505560 n=1 Tax=Leptopilina heterotoma TaxID=63436 RepID=UPI001CA87CA9|nr:uncharacterized protein LOC122505560 [Leptopilina heterotoma]
MYKKEEFLFSIAICLLMILKNVNSFNYDKCDPMRCSRGPIRFYEDMYCKPFYVRAGDCCPLKYDCSEVDKYNVNEHCFANGNVYGIDDKVNDNDVQDEKNCYCIKDNLNVPNINCNGWKCPEVRLPRSKKNCYIKYTNATCESEVVCTEDPLECEINGNVLKEGQKITLPGTETNKDCLCQQEIEDVMKIGKIFCYDKKNFCGRESLFRKILTEKRAPLYYSDSHIHPQSYCPVFSKAYRKGDTVISNLEMPDSFGKCTFGPLTMGVFSRLNKYNAVQNTYSCAICKCVIAPTLTCQVLPLDECQEKFEEFKRKNPDYIDKLNNCTLIDKDL